MKLHRPSVGILDYWIVDANEQCVDSGGWTAPVPTDILGGNFHPMPIGIQEMS